MFAGSREGGGAAPAILHAMTATPPPDGAPRPDPPIVEEADRLRVCSVSGLAGALAIVIAFFLPWVTVKPEAAAAYRERVVQRLEDDQLPTPPHAEDWRRLAEHVGRDRRAAGIDVFWWARIASVDAQGNVVNIAAPGANALVSRAITVGAVWLGALPVLSVLLFAYFLTHHCKRARSPALITAMLVGAAAVLTTGAYDIISAELGQELDSAVGLTVLLLGGAVLFLAGSFGVKARNWWKVFGGTIVIAGILYLGIRSFVEGPRLVPDSGERPSIESGRTDASAQSLSSSSLRRFSRSS